jgi:cyclic 2,3-diphosphoglycerate synthetase
MSGSNRKKPRAVVLVDGEHYLANIQDSLKALSSNVQVDLVLFIGGTEKIGSFESIRSEIGFPTGGAFKGNAPDIDALKEQIGSVRPDQVIDLSDEPVVDYQSRMLIANHVLRTGARYQGADFTFEPVRFRDILKKPSLALWGTGKRIGKTAMGGFVARTLQKAGLTPAVVTLSRGGPGHPHLLRGDQVRLDARSLLDFQNEGLHAASDYFEDALTGKCITIGCRRCGGGLAGQAFFSILQEGARMANDLDQVDAVVLEGSGSTLPDVKAGRVILLTSAAQELWNISGYFGPYRILGADLVIVGGCDPVFADAERVSEAVRAIRRLNPEARIATVVFRPRPLGHVRDRTVFFATTAPEQVLHLLTDHLEDQFGCRVTGVSNALSDQERLKSDLREKGAEADVLLTELKASAISTVAAEGLEQGKQVEFCDNVPVIVPGGDIDDLESTVAELMEDVK